MNVYQYAERLLAARRYTRATFRRKLEEKGFSEEETDEALGFYENLLDDRDYALRFAKDCAKLKHYGKARIRFELIKKGISAELAQDVLEELELDEAATVAAVLERRFQKTDDRQKILRYFASRGYSAETVRAAIGQAFGEEE